MSRRKAPEDCLIQPKHEWKWAEVNLIKKELTGKTYAQVAELISKRFGWNCQYYHIKKYCKDHGISNGFNRGWGKTGEERLFSKNRKYEKPYKIWCVKVGKGAPGADRYGWKPKHIILWEKNKGKIPEGHLITFIDGNRENCTIENLALITKSQASTRAQLARHYGIRSYDQESSDALNTLADLIRVKNTRKRKKKGGEP